MCYVCTFLRPYVTILYKTNFEYSVFFNFCSVTVVRPVCVLYTSYSLSDTHSLLVCFILYILLCYRGTHYTRTFYITCIPHHEQNVKFCVHNKHVCVYLSLWALFSPFNEGYKIAEFFPLLKIVRIEVVSFPAFKHLSMPHAHACFHLACMCVVGVKGWNQDKIVE